jgi:two-component system cell cycle sensor histidine kinase/response regulator CckA
LLEEDLKIITNSKDNILVVDDEPDINLALKLFLEQSGFKVATFTDPLLALQNFRKGLYDLLILDIKMPKMHGCELYREIKKIDNKVKACFLTAGEMCHGAHTDIFDESQFIRKPVENAELIKRIYEIMNVC